MTKTATITCEFEYGLQIGQLTSQDVELFKQVTRFCGLEIEYRWGEDNVR